MIAAAVREFRPDLPPYAGSIDLAAGAVPHGAISRPEQACTEPLNKIIIIRGASRNAQDYVGEIRLFRPEDIVASLDQQHSQIECRSLVAVNEAVVQDNPMNQCGGLFMDAAVIAVARSA